MRIKVDSPKKKGVFPLVSYIQIGVGGINESTTHNKHPISTPTGSGSPAVQTNGAPKAKGGQYQATAHAG